MNPKKLTDSDLRLLNSSEGLYSLLKNKKINLTKSLQETHYISQLRRHQEELIKLQNLGTIHYPIFLAPLEIV